MKRELNSSLFSSPFPMAQRLLIASTTAALFNFWVDDMHVASVGV
jgi:hypothetical protein